MGVENCSDDSAEIFSLPYNSISATLAFPFCFVRVTCVLFLPSSASVGVGKVKMITITHKRDPKKEKKEKRNNSQKWEIAFHINSNNLRVPTSLIIKSVKRAEISL